MVYFDYLWFILWVFFLKSYSLSFSSALKLEHAWSIFIFKLRCGLFAIAKLNSDTYECKLCKDQKWCLEICSLWALLVSVSCEWDCRRSERKATGDDVRTGSTDLRRPWFHHIFSVGDWSTATTEILAKRQNRLLLRSRTKQRCHRFACRALVGVGVLEIVGVYSAVPGSTMLYQCIVHCIIDSHCISTQSLVKFHLQDIPHFHPCARYACKLMIQELMTMNILPRLVLHVPQTNHRHVGLYACSRKLWLEVWNFTRSMLELHAEETFCLGLVNIAYVGFDVSTRRAPSQASYSCCDVLCFI